MASLFAKLQYKNQETILLLNAPAEFQPYLTEIVEQAHIDNAPDGDKRYDFAIVFVKSGAEVAASSALASTHMNNDAVLWFAYPKKSSQKYQTDINRDRGWQPLGDLGYEPVRQVAIDADWSALRFRAASHIKSMTRGFAMSEEGKRRTKKS